MHLLLLGLPISEKPGGRVTKEQPTKNLQGISTEFSWNYFQNPRRDFLSQDQKEASIGPADRVFQVTDVTLSHFNFLDAEAVDIASNDS